MMSSKSLISPFYESNINLFKNKRTMVDDLIAERESIIYELEQAKEDFLAKNK